MTRLKALVVWLRAARASFGFKRDRLAIRFRRELALEREVVVLRRENAKLRLNVQPMSRALLRRDSGGG